MINQVGEKKIQYKGADLILRPDFKALTDIEVLLGESILKLLDRFIESEPKLMDLAIIIFCCSRASDDNTDKPQSIEEVGTEILRVGMSAYLGVLECVSYVLSGGEEAQKKTELSGPQVENSNGESSTE